MTHRKTSGGRKRGTGASRDAARAFLPPAPPRMLLLVVVGLLLVMMTAMAAAAMAAPLRPVAAEGDPGHAARATFRFGVFPYLPALKMDKIFGPVALSLAKDLGVNVHLRTKPTFEEFAEELAHEAYDIILVHPFFYVDSHDNHNYLPVARLDEPLTAVVMVADDSPLRNVLDLKGKTLALPPPLAGVSELAKITLIDAGLQPDREVTLRYYRTKMSCLQAVVLREADACAVPDFLLRQLKTLGEMRLRPLLETPTISHFVFAVHERVPEAYRRALLACILRWPDTDEGRRVMEAGAWTRFVEATDEDYNVVRRYRARLQAYYRLRAYRDAENRHARR